MSYLELGGKRITIPVGAVGIGADPSSQVVLTGGPVLPHHAVIQGYADGQVAIRRATEEAEILVNGVRLGPQPTPLLHGDKVQVGQHELRFVDERRSGSTQYVAAVDPAMLAAMAKPSSGKAREATAGTGGRVVSLTDGREYVISGASMVFGRDAGCDVVITDKNVSRRHAEIMATPKGYVLVDSSTNGTFVNGERIEGQRLLARADVIRIGNDEFRFYADRAPVAPGPGPGKAAPSPGAVPAAAPRSPPTPEPPPAMAKSPPHASAKSPLESTAGTPAGPPARAAAPVTPGPPVAAPGAQQRLAHTVAGIPTSAPRPPTSAPPVAPPPAQPVRPPTAPKAAAPAPPQKGPPPGGVLANLVVRSGALKGQRLPIRVPIVNVGRAEYNDIVLPDDSVSTSHAKLQRREGVWVLVDLESTNGSFVDAERVQGETPLAPGALLRLGDVQLLFEPTDDTVDAAKGSSTKMMSAIRIPPGSAAVLALFLLH
ncbi:MAG TPA: FHA domain-containing protein [Gemmatimonadales bacterium]|jgi:pSer/pThr/pTyr-binding forkhead associated (FHA) protein|nr:FHA domain-containing protein [Gemmatimonadales bacterium]